MAFGVSIEPFEYILESDRGLPSELQTRFVVIPHTTRVTDRITTLFANARKSAPRKADQYDDEKWNAARIEAFCLTVSKVINFMVPEKGDPDQVRVLVPQGRSSMSSTVNNITTGWVRRRPSHSYRPWRGCSVRRPSTRFRRPLIGRARCRRSKKKVRVCHGVPPPTVGQQDRSTAVLLRSLPDE